MASQGNPEMARMMGKGSTPTNLNCHGIVAQHTASAANDASDCSINDAIYDSYGRNIFRRRFTAKETWDLLIIWARPETQWQLKFNFRNFGVYETIAQSMHEKGNRRTADQCKNRIKHLIKRFNLIKNSQQDHRSFEFPYYKFIHEVMEGKKNETAAMGQIERSPPGAKFVANFSGCSNGMVGNSDIKSNSISNSGIAAHMALVEEYQHLINGNPESNSTSCPQVILSEGNSPITLEAQESGSHSYAAKPSQNAYSSKFKANEDDCATISGEGGSLPSEHEPKIVTSNNGSYRCAEDRFPSDRNGGLSGEGHVKRSFPSMFDTYMKSKYACGGGVVGRKKCPGAASMATDTSSRRMSDPIVGQYLAEILDIKRQRLELERERAQNKRTMMMCMMQIRQAIVCPNQCEEEDGEDRSGRSK